jgi:glycosyltransferase involved in cell wall biosynthesis
MATRVSDHRTRARIEALQALAIDLGQKDFDERYPELHFSPVVVLICAYEEEANLGAVLAKVPATACGLDVTTLVVVDGGTDATDAVALAGGALTFVFPTNLGHGLALRVGYRIAVAHGARFVVTPDADGQNDPGEIETILQPLVDDEADFVVASRRLGVDTTADSYRKAGVVFFAWLMNRLNHTSLTDTSNGYRALRATMLADIVDRLEQEQYQTAELLTTAVRRGWRVTERPAVWHERTSGESKKGTNFLYGFRYARVLLNTWLRER